MKKRLILSIIALLLLLFAGFGIHYLLSLRKVTFELDDQTSEITIHSSSDTIIKQLSSSGQIFLQEGEYYIIPKGTNIAQDKIKFSVADKDMAVTIRPAYTDEFLTGLVDDEMDAIKTAITKKYPSALNDYTLSQGSLYARGEWFGGLLKPKVSDIREQKDPYRIVLHKKSSSWEVVRRPEYSLGAARYQEVPIDILRKINLVVGEPGS